MWTYHLIHINKLAKDFKKKNVLPTAFKKKLYPVFWAAGLTSFSSSAKPPTCIRHFKVTRNMCSNTTHEVEEGCGTGAYQWALMFVRKSCLTICRLPPQHTRIWNWSSTISCSQQRGQRESKVTAKDLPQSVMGCGGGGLCVTPQLLRYVLWVTSTSSLLQNITLITLMPDCLSASGWILLWLP